MRFSGIDVDPVVTAKRCGVEARAIREKRIAAKIGRGGLQMQAAGHRNGDDFVVVPSEESRELADAFGIASFGEADKEFAADAKNVAAFERAGEGDVFKLSEFRKGLRERSTLAAAGFRAQRQYHGDFIED